LSLVSSRQYERFGDQVLTCNLPRFTVGTYARGPRFTSEVRPMRRIS
jgi:hypothetical protein